MISDASSLKKNNDQSLYWIEVFCNCRRILKVAIPSKRETYESLDESMEDVRDKAVEVLFDLSMRHYISNVKRNDRTMRINFKECLGGRKPNFGHRTVKKVVKIIETCSPKENLGF